MTPCCGKSSEGGWREFEAAGLRRGRKGGRGFGDAADEPLGAEAADWMGQEESADDPLEVLGADVGWFPCRVVDGLVDGVGDVLEAEASAEPRPQRPRLKSMPA